MANVLTFHVEYGSLGKQLWRDIEISDKKALDQLGFAVLATFDTLACHLFEFELRGKVFALPGVDYERRMRRMPSAVFEKLKLELGESFKMRYDFGTTQDFTFTLIKSEPMRRGQGTAYPRIADGRGRGIIDDLDEGTLAELIVQVEKNGKTDEPIYYPPDRRIPWNFNDYDIETDNFLLKSRIIFFADEYAQISE